MRSFDNWNKYTDNDNHPLHGCIHFVVNDGNTSAPIYDKDGIPLDNPQLTDIYGRTQHQVFIEEDVIAYYYKYIGNGEWYTEMNINPSDTSKWQLQYTSKSELFINIESESKSSYGVLNIDNLRKLSPTSVPSIDGVKVITLMGYNEAGDKEPINYIWDSESTEPDDGGAVIATDLLKGRWVMVTPTEHLDVRHYGVFPSDSTNMIDQTISIQHALEYANNHGLRLFFDTLTNTQHYHYYKLTNITLNPINQIDLAKGVTFIDNDVTIHSQQTNVFNNDPYFLNGDTTLYSNYVKSSWNIKSLYKSKNNEESTYIIDDNNKSNTIKTLQDWNVDVEQNISGYTFKDCNVYGSGLITDSSFTNCNMNMKGTLSDNNSYTSCHLNEYMFSGSPTVGQVDNCIVDIDDFSHKVNLWRNLIFIMKVKDIDFKNVLIPEDFYIVNQELGDRTYSNFIGTGTSHTFGESSIQHTYRFNNFKGNIRIPGNTNNTYIFDNCDITLSFADPNKEFNITIKDSNIVFSDNMSKSTIMSQNSNVTLQGTCKNVSLRDSTLNGSGLTTDSFTSYNCILLEIITSKNSVVKDSQVNKEFTQTVRQLDTEITVNSKYDNTLSVTTKNIIDGYFDNNIFNDRLNLSSNLQNTLVRGLVIINNLSNIDNPVTITGRASQIHEADDLHQYIYKNNSGTMSTETVVTINITRLGNPPWNYSDIENVVGVPGKVIYSPVIRNSNMNGVFASSLLYIDSQGVPQYNRNQYFSEVNLFTIGTKNVHTNIEVSIEDEQIYLSSSDTGIEKSGGMLSNCNTIICSPHSQGYTWSYTNSYINYPYNIEWDNVTEKWRIKNLRIALGEPSYNDYVISIKQI